MTQPGLQRFAAVLTEHTGDLPEAVVAAMGARLTAPLGVAVTGRSGVGRGTVAAVLARCPGIRVTGSDPEVQLRVLAEVVKPEDADAFRGPGRPDLLIVNKADLAGLRPGGPVAATARDCAEITARTGIPAEPMVALAVLAGLDEYVVDDEVVAALRVLLAEPPVLTGADDFLAAGPLPAPMRARLLEHLDLFGIAHAVVELRADAEAGVAELRERLRAAGRLPAVLDAVVAAGARACYRRIETAERALAELAVAEPETADRVAGLFADPRTVAARGQVAAQLFGALGDPGTPVDRARYWRRRADGPLDALHRAAAGALSRAALAESA